MSAMESAQAQQNGLTAVYWVLGVDNTLSVNNEIRSSLPVNFASLHLCYDIPKEFAACCAAISTLNTQHRMRYRPHFGTFLNGKHFSCLFTSSRFPLWLLLYCVCDLIRWHIVFPGLFLPFFPNLGHRLCFLGGNS